MKPREKPEDFELSSTAHATKLGEYAWLRASRAASAAQPNSTVGVASMLEVISAAHANDYCLHIRFNNGESGIVDVTEALWGEVFEPLRDLSAFCRFQISPVSHTVCWENGANLAPEYFYTKMIEQRDGAPVPASASGYEILHVTAARYIRDYRVWLEFSDGSSGEADLSSALWGPMFEPLRDQATFSQLQFDPEMDTIVWPNGADLAPECLKGLVTQHPVWQRRRLRTCLQIA